MNKKTIIFMLVVTLVLFVISFYVFREDEKSWKKTEKDTSLIPESLDVNKVAHISISNSDETVSLFKDAGIWKVKERLSYPADFSKISEALMKLGQVKIVQTIKAGKSQFGRMDLLNPLQNKDNKSQTGVQIQLYDKNKKLMETITLGKEHFYNNETGRSIGMNYPDGRYVLVASYNQPVLISDTLSSISTSPSSWLDKDFLKIENLKSIQYESIDKNKNWIISRENKDADFILHNIPNDQQANKSEISSVTSAFNYFNFNDIYTAESDISDKDKFDKTASLKLKSFDGLSYDVKIALKGNDGIVNVSVSGEFSEKRSPVQGEKAEVTQKLDKEFADNLKKLRNKLKHEQAFSKWNYLISKNKIETLMKPKSKLLKKKEDKSKDTNTNKKE